MLLLLDSVILIDYLNTIPAAEAYLDATPQAVISVVTMAEVLTGVDEDGFDEVAEFLETFSVFPINAEIAKEAARLRRQYRWRLPDALQAATALHYGGQLVTRNTKDFHPDRHSFVVIPYTL